MNKIENLVLSALSTVDRGLTTAAAKGDKIINSANEALNSLKNFNQTLVPNCIQGKVIDFAEAHPKIAKYAGITLMVFGTLAMIGVIVASVMVGGHGVIGVAVIASVNAGGFAMAGVGLILHRAAKRAALPDDCEAERYASILDPGTHLIKYKENDGSTGILKIVVP